MIVFWPDNSPSLKNVERLIQALRYDREAAATVDPVPKFQLRFGRSAFVCLEFNRVEAALVKRVNVVDALQVASHAASGGGLMDAPERRIRHGAGAEVREDGLLDVGFSQPPPPNP
jgi:hypothetical protein